MKRKQYYKLLKKRMKGNTLWKKTVPTQFKKGHKNLRPATSTKYGTKLYYAWTKKVLKRDNYLCMGCGQKAQIVHHPKSREKYPELIIEMSNGVSLCRKCHINIHRKDLKK